MVVTQLAPSTGSKSQVLVVEDELRMCSLLMDVLEVDGLDAVCVHSDLEAFDALRRDSAYACMVVDVNLGAGMTGYDVARYARRLDPSLPVIYVSGQTTEESFRANGVAGSLFVPKPFTPDELMARLRTLIGDNDD